MMTPSVFFLLCTANLSHGPEKSYHTPSLSQETVLEGRKGGRKVTPSTTTHSFILVKGIVYFLQKKAWQILEINKRKKKYF